jgi:hypothetical protein
MAQTLAGRPDMAAAAADGQEILQRVVGQGKRLRDSFPQGDAEALRMVVANLADNAGKHALHQLDATTTRKVGGVGLVGAGVGSPAAGNLPGAGGVQRP